MLKRLAHKADGMGPYPDPRFPPSIYYRFLCLLASEMEPKLSVELGVCGGGASFHLALGWRHGTVIGVEHAKGNDRQQANWKFIRDNCINFRLWEGDSINSALDIFNEYGSVNILFIDTIHTYQRTIDEFKAWQPYMAENAVVCLDDLHRVQMAGVWNWMPKNKVRLDNLHCGSTEGGFGVIWK